MVLCDFRGCGYRFGAPPRLWPPCVRAIGVASLRPPPPPLLGVIWWRACLTGWVIITRGAPWRGARVARPAVVTCRLWLVCHCPAGRLVAVALLRRRASDCLEVRYCYYTIGFGRMSPPTYRGNARALRYASGSLSACAPLPIV